VKGAAADLSLTMAANLPFVEFENCLFEENSSAKAPINIQELVTVKMNNCIIANNIAYTSGVLSIDGTKSNMEITNTIFQNNVANRNGGAMYIGTAFVNITATSFIGNTAGTNGGAIAMDTFFAGKLYLTDVTGINNIAGNVGGFGYNLNVEMVRTVLNFNSAGTNGGALYFDPITVPLDCETLMKQVTFTGNTATLGAAMYFKNSLPVCTDICNIGNIMYTPVMSNSNSLITTNKCQFQHNQATDGNGYGNIMMLAAHTIVYETNATNIISKPLPVLQNITVSIIPGLKFDLNFSVRDIHGRIVTVSGGGISGNTRNM
jgi:predicted outer membrane repeat protein